MHFFSTWYDVFELFRLVHLVHCKVASNPYEVYQYISVIINGFISNSVCILNG